MNAECERVLASLSAYADGELDAAEVARIDGHLVDCRPCSGAHRRLARLEEMSRRLLGRAAPPVSPAEWRARWDRIDGASVDPGAIASNERKARIVRLYAIRGTLALAATLLVAAMGLPLLAGGASPKAVDHSAHLCFSSAPGANSVEALEVGDTSEGYTVGVQYPSGDSDDAVVIMISKL